VSVTKGAQHQYRFGDEGLLRLIRHAIEAGISGCLEAFEARVVLSPADIDRAAARVKDEVTQAMQEAGREAALVDPSGAPVSVN
jgi:DNA-binding FadR family transcriptional regulator